MNLSLRSLGAALALTVGLAAPASAEIFFQDTYVSIRNLWQDKQPGYAGNVDETALNIAYANAWTYGSNFASIDIENFSHQDPANSAFGGYKTATDSLELYALYRTVLSGNKIFGGNKFSFGPIKDIGLEFGADVDTQDDQFASYKRLLVFGPNFSIDVPKGFLNIGVHISKEWNTNAYLPNNTTSFNPAPELEVAWLFPFNVGPVPLKFTGFLNVIGPKGKGNKFDVNHGAEVLAHPKLMVDVGALLGGKPNAFDAGVGFEYWYNKFGNEAKYLPGTTQDAFFVEAGYHF